MPSDTAATWNRLPEGGRGVLPALDAVAYGPDIGTEADFRLLGNVAGKRVLDVGCAAGQNLAALSKQGAIASSCSRRRARTTACASRAG